MPPERPATHKSASRRGRPSQGSRGGPFNGHAAPSFDVRDRELNATLPERFKGPRRAPDAYFSSNPRSSSGLDLTLNRDIGDYVQKQEHDFQAAPQDSWLSQPEIPTCDELSVSEAALAPNKVHGAYKSKERYLKTQYNLLREDAVGSLRDALQDFRQNPSTNDTPKFSVYEQVHIVGFTFARRGLAARIQFSTKRAGKRIAWQTSKRLVSGSIVALVRAKDKLTDLKGLVVAVVAARPLAGVLCMPPEIDIYFGRPEDVQLDPQEEWLMVEARQGYYEAYRHTLRALQKLNAESFPLADTICHLASPEAPPAYIQDNPVLDLSAPASAEQKPDYVKVDVTRDWPPPPDDSLDEFQWKAIREIMTKRLAIIQGPPGTGKTFCSKFAIEILLANRKPNDPPTIIAAQTNHALDQLLGHVSVFEANYIRLGGRSTNTDVKQHALFEIRQKDRIPLIPGGLLAPSNCRLTKQAKAMAAILAPLAETPDFFATGLVSGPQVLVKLGVLTAQQAQSLEDGASQWVSAAEVAEGPIQLWLDRAALRFEVKYSADDYGFGDAVDDEDLEFEQLRETEDSNGINDEEDIELLRGSWVGLRERFRVEPPSTVDLANAAKLLDEVQDFWKIPEYLRGPVYHVMQARAKEAMAKQFRAAAHVYNKIVKDILVGKWEQDVVYLQRAAIIGMTTTGLSKYRPIISALKPKTVLVEEAAEVLEAPVVAACLDSLQHLILVGDHKQLQGHCSVQELEGEPFNLNISLFERLVRNEMPYQTLLCQRRMAPEFRKLISGLYPDLTDHVSVINRPMETWGMGDVRSFFFDHRWPEYKDESFSIYNEEEAKFIAGFYCFLFKNDVSPDRITILTFYNGQRKRLLRELRAYPELQGKYLRVKTVNGYQGEENDLVILSLVRSNVHGNIGFLANENRACVALSRAKLGFYIFGNSHALGLGSQLWSNVSLMMSVGGPRRLHHCLPTLCAQHQTTTLRQYPEDWLGTEGGCLEYCRSRLKCGHICPLRCHPFGHDRVTCPEECPQTLPCGHGCMSKCSQPCFCPCQEFVASHPLTLPAPLEPSCLKTAGPAPATDPAARQSRPCHPSVERGQSLPSRGSTPHLQTQLSPTASAIRTPRGASMYPAAVRHSSFFPKNRPSAKKSLQQPRAGPEYWGLGPGREASRVSPQKESELRDDWNSFASTASSGGASPAKSASGLGNEAGRMNLPTRHSPCKIQSASDPGRAAHLGPLVTETITGLDRGRNRYVHEYNPASGTDSHGTRTTLAVESSLARDTPATSSTANGNGAEATDD